MTNRNRSVNTVSSTAAAAQTTSGPGRFKGKKRVDNERIERSTSSSDSPRCDHCRSTYHKLDSCIKKQNEEMKSTIASLVSRMDAIGGAKLAMNKSSDEVDSDFSERMARSATACQARRTTCVSPSGQKVG